MPVTIAVTVASDEEADHLEKLFRASMNGGDGPQTVIGVHRRQDSNWWSFPSIGYLLCDMGNPNRFWHCPPSKPDVK